MTLGISLVNLDELTGGIVPLQSCRDEVWIVLVVGCIAYRIESTNIGDMKGLIKRMPLTTAAFIIGGLSLIGVPGTVGFISKWYLVVGALKGGYHVVAALTLISPYSQSSMSGRLLRLLSSVNQRALYSVNLRRLAC